MRGWGPFRRAVVEVADAGIHYLGNGIYRLHKPWRRAKESDLAGMSPVRHKAHHRIALGARVRANQEASFHGGALGVVVFQDPSGRVWVQRDGTEHPCYYWNNELDVL